MKRPNFLRLSINGVSVQLHENPYNALKSASKEPKNMMSAKQQEFATLIMTQSFKQKLQQNQYDDILLKVGVT